MKKLQSITMDGEEFLVIGIFTVEEKDYIALVKDKNIYLYQYQGHKDGTFEAFDIEDDDEFTAVVQEFEYIESNQLWDE